MNRLWLVAIGALALVGLCEPSKAQSVPVFGVTTCGTPPTTITNGKPAYLTVLVGSGVLCTNSSGGGGGGAVFGPTAAGSAAANPPVLIGGTVDGTATGAVDNLKVSGGLAFINCANCSGSGASAADEAAFVAGTSLLAPSGGFFQTTATTNPLTTGQTGMVQMTANRAFMVNLRSSAGVEEGNSTTPMQVSLANTASNATPVLVTGTGGTFPVSQATASSLNAQVVGNIASGNVDSGNGVKISGVYNTTLPTLTATDRADLQTDVAGNIRVAMVLPNGIAGSDAVSNSNVGFLRTNTGQSSIGLPIAGGYVFNGTTWDRLRSGTDTGSIIVDQATAANLNATVAPSSLTAWGLVSSTQNSASPTNAQLADCQFNTAPTTVTSGNVTPIQCNNAGAVNVAIVSGGGSGGTASSFGSGFPATGTAIGLTNGTNMVAWSATTNYGTAPSAIAVPAVNSYVTNTNANGQATAANSSPVVLPAAQVTADPCSLGAKTNLAISYTTTSITQQIALSGSTKIYVCSLSLIASVATVFSVTGGTGTNCGTPAALIGTTSATNGLSLAANGGLTLGNGAGTVAVTGAGSELCLVQSGAGSISGNLTYVQQ